MVQLQTERTKAGGKTQKDRQFVFYGWGGQRKKAIMGMKAAAQVFIFTRTWPQAKLSQMQFIITAEY